MMMVYGDHFLFGSRVREKGPFADSTNVHFISSCQEFFSSSLSFSILQKKSFLPQSFLLKNHMDTKKIKVEK